MGDKSAIQWTDATWNPVRGCSRVSAGCEHCYAESVAARFSGPGQPYEGLATRVNGHPRWTNTARAIPEHLNDPLRWKRPRRIFVNSMSDLFHEDVPFEFIDRVFEVICECRGRHTFQILTKRPARMNGWFRHAQERYPGWFHNGTLDLWQTWLGVSVEHQAAMDERFPLLVQTPAAVRFLSMEPLLEHVDIATWMWSAYGAVKWVIIGGESGSGARPCGESVVEHALNQARDGGASVFVKQMGSRWAKDNFAHDSHGGDPSEWPAYLRVREFPS